VLDDDGRDVDALPAQLLEHTRAEAVVADLADV
jgi:hypothetical protein